MEKATVYPHNLHQPTKNLILAHIGPKMSSLGFLKTKKTTNLGITGNNYDGFKLCCSVWVFSCWWW